MFNVLGWYDQQTETELKCRRIAAVLFNKWKVLKTPSGGKTDVWKNMKD